MHRLVAVPDLRPFESGASWLSRAALSQGCKVNELRKFLDIDRRSDPDLVFNRGMIQRIAPLCGLDAKSFGFVQRMLSSLRVIDRDGYEFLLGNGVTARYRFCRVCLAQPSGTYLPLHWRFKCWRWCPLHSCLMEDKCPHCDAYVHAPAEMTSAGPKAEGVASLDRCMRCGELLSVAWRDVEGLYELDPTRALETSMLINGRAVLAALFYRKFHIAGTEQEFSLIGMRRILKQGLIPHDRFYLVNSMIVERRNKKLTAEIEEAARRAQWRVNGLP